MSKKKDKKESFLNGFNGKRSLITIVLLVFATSFVGGAMWFVMNKNIEKEKAASDRSIRSLKNIINNLKENKPKNDSSSNQADYSLKIRKIADNYLSTRKNNSGATGITFLTKDYLEELGGETEAKSLFSSGAITHITANSYSSAQRIDEMNYKLSYQETVLYQGTPTPYVEYIFFKKVDNQWLIYKDSLFSQT